MELYNWKFFTSLGFFEAESSVRAPWYAHLVWALCYFCILSFLAIASSPFTGSRKFRMRWSAYSVFYLFVILWMMCGFIGHTPFFVQAIDFDIDEPASLFMPLFWAGLLLLLLQDFTHYRAQLLLRDLSRRTKRGTCSRSVFRWAYESVRTKFKISFGRSFSEATLSSLTVSALCCVLHASEASGAPSSYQLSNMIANRPNRQHNVKEFVRALDRAQPFISLSESELPEWVSSNVISVWTSCMFILLYNHWLERTARVRGIFWDDETDERPGREHNSHHRQKLRQHSPSRWEHRDSAQEASDMDRGSELSTFSAVSEDRLDTGGDGIDIAIDTTDTRPMGKKGMAGWYDYALTQTALDMFIHLNIFSGRFDMRQLLASRNINEEIFHGGATSEDPFFHDHSADPVTGKQKTSLVFDFMADCGDGFDSSYAVARMLAQPRLKLKRGERIPPRGEVLIIGGDLAYPRPSRENYEERFLRVFEDAMPPPLEYPSYDEEHDVVVEKAQLDELLKTTRPSLSASSLPPCAYIVPGNHDWFDGLSCFLRYVVFRNRLGGWLLPQTRSYFCIKLPHDWYIFGMDNGLEADIDPQQAAYFASVSRNLPESAKVVVVTHDPNWVLDQYYGLSKDRTGKYLEHLMNTELRGKVRLRLAGDVHNYQRQVPVDPRGHDHKESQRDESKSKEQAGDSRSLPALVIAGGGGAFLHPTHCLGHEPLVGVAGTQGATYRRAAAYPSSQTSSALSFQNLVKFRLRNWRFDVIGGTLYLALAHPLFSLPGCDLVPAVTGPGLSPATVSMFVSDVFRAILLVLSSSTISLMVFITLWAVAVAGVDSRKQGVRLWLGSAHAFLHLCTACAIVVLCQWVLSSLEGYGNLGEGGMYRQWDKFTARFPAAAEGVEWAGNHTLGVVSTVIQHSMLIADSPQTVLLLQRRMCPLGPGVAPLKSEETILLWGIRALWYWVLACPLVSHIVAAYLYVSVGWLGMHWNEGFSSLQHTGFKSFVRCKVTTDGDLELYTVGLDKCPAQWELDPEHAREAERSASDQGSKLPSWQWKRPSRWQPRPKDPSHRSRSSLNLRLVGKYVVRA